jgi:hypothetical protein
VSTKAITPVWSPRVCGLFSKHYGIAFAGFYLGQRNLYLIQARAESDAAIRALAISRAKVTHRNYLRCLRDHQREASLPTPRLLLRQAV